MQHFTELVYEKKDKIAIITINRPDRANALSTLLVEELKVVLNMIQSDTKVSTLILTGTGPKAFCAGADLKERKNMNDSDVRLTVENLGSICDQISHLAIPTIAALNGVAYGGGLEIALSCDLRVANHNIKLGLTETSLAIIPGAGGTQRLTRLIGLGQAKKMILTAEPITAEYALQIGLIEDITTDSSVTAMDLAIEISEKINKNGPIAIKLAKKAIDQGFDLSLSEGLEIEHKLYKQTIYTKDRKEGLLAFSEKRKPSYRNE